MRFAPRTLHRLSFLPALVLLLAAPASSQNLLVNPGFDRDLSGWTVATTSSPSGFALASSAWDPADAQASVSSGSAAFRLQVSLQQTASASLSQCVAVRPSSAYAAFGAIRIARQQNATLRLNVTFFDGAGCAGTPTNGAGAWALAPLLFEPNDSAGAWLPASAQAVSPAAARSARFELLLSGFGTFYASSASFDGAADDAFFGPSGTNTWILPSAARVSGAGGSAWTTVLTLANPGASDAVATLKFLGHDGDGRSGPEKALVVRAGALVRFADVLGGLFGVTNGYGAIRISSSSSSLVVQSETATPATGGGTVGQALPAFDASLFATASPKSLAPIRENAAFRSNLVLANPTELPVTAQVVLHAADGAVLGARDVALPPLGMTQISRVASALGAATLDAGRISVSTATPGGSVTAYASVLDNVTNDPRTLLPQDTAPAASGPNLLTNAGFDRDLTGWTLTLSEPGPNASRSGAWVSDDADGRPESGSVSLSSGSAGFNGFGWAVLGQCVPAVPGRGYALRAKVRGASWGFFGNAPQPGLGVSYFASADCSGDVTFRTTRDVSPFRNGVSTDWLVLPVAASTAPSATRSARVELWTGASGSVHGSGIGAQFDHVVFSEGQSTWTSFVPAAASTVGVNGSRWTTSLILSNAGTEDATVYISGISMNIRAGATLVLPDVVHDTLGLSLTWLPLRIVATSPGVAVTAETSSATGNGSVGQALPALTSGDLAGTVPKAIAPVRDDGAFRTNLVLFNTTDLDVVAHVDLFDAAGALVGSRDVPLPGRGAVQIGGVAWSLTGGPLDAGRISVSTQTPGGAIAAYASVIDNVTNDPRTLLPR